MKYPHIPTMIIAACVAAVVCFEANALTATEQADAFHARGVAAENRGDLVAAENCYNLALRVIAGHAGAQARLAELEKKVPPIDEILSMKIRDGKHWFSGGSQLVGVLQWLGTQCDAEGIKLLKFETQDRDAELSRGLPLPPNFNNWTVKAVMDKAAALSNTRFFVQRDKYSYKVTFYPANYPPTIQPGVSTVRITTNPELLLDETPPINAKVGWGRYSVNLYEDKNARILLDGHPCKHYIFPHASSTVTFTVPPGFSRFSAIGIGPTIAGRKEYSWTYELQADGKAIYTSQRLDTYPGNKVAIEVSLPPGTRTITLITDNMKNGFADHSIWANPKLLPPPLSAETQAKLTQLETQFKSACATNVEPTYTQAMQTLRTKYLASLQRGLETAKSSGDTASVTAMEQEIRRATDIASVPNTDTPGTPATLITLRTAYRKFASTTAATRASQLKPLYDSYDAALASFAKTLAGKPAEAAAVKAVRSKLAGTREIAQTSKPAPVTQPAESAKSTPASPGGSAIPGDVSKERPFVNSLGMKFVPVPTTGGPIHGRQVLFSVWDTRVKDYAAYAAATGQEVKKPGFEQTENHPVVNVSWNDAKAFCAWLSKKEGREYHLPADYQWSMAAGLGTESGSTPEGKSGKVPGYPWGGAWPPPKGVGNYAPSLSVDGFEKTSPVGSFGADRSGLYDMGGNVRQWCEGWYDPVKKDRRVLRGASWISSGEIDLRSSYRSGGLPTDRSDNDGFRCVLVVSGG